MSLGDIWGASDKPKETVDDDTAQTLQAWAYLRNWVSCNEDKPLEVCVKLGINPYELQDIRENNRIKQTREWVRLKATLVGWRIGL